MGQEREGSGGDMNKDVLLLLPVFTGEMHYNDKYSY